VYRLGQEHLLAEVVLLGRRDQLIVRRRLLRVAGCGVPRSGAPALSHLMPEDQRDVHVPSAEHPHRLRRFGFGQPQVDAGMPLMQDRRGGRHNRAERRGKRGQPQPPGPQPGEHRELILRCVKPADYLGSPLGEQSPRVGEPDAAPSPLDELGTRLRLQPGQMVTDRRLGVVQRVGRRGDRPVPGDGHQHAEPRYIQHGPTIKAVDRFAQTPIPY